MNAALGRPTDAPGLAVPVADRAANITHVPRILRLGAQEILPLAHLDGIGGVDELVVALGTAGTAEGDFGGFGHG